MIPYPDNHPKAFEIKAMEQKCEEHYLAIKQLDQRARDAYQAGLIAFKEFGEVRKEGHDHLKALAALLEELKGLVMSPLV